MDGADKWTIGDMAFELLSNVVFSEAQEWFFDELVTNVPNRNHAQKKECGTREPHIKIFGRQSQLDRGARHLGEKEKVQ